MVFPRGFDLATRRSNVYEVGCKYWDATGDMSRYSNKHMPLVVNQCPDRASYSCADVLVYELSANLYGSWGKGWSDVLNISHHRDLINLNLWILDRITSIGSECFLETVLTPGGRIHSYRWWFPLNVSELGQFVVDSCGQLVTWISGNVGVGGHAGGDDGPPSKRTRTSSVKEPHLTRQCQLPPRLGSNHMATKQDVTRAFRIYLGGVNLPTVEAGPIATGAGVSNLAPTHIVRLMSAVNRFADIAANNIELSHGQHVLANYMAKSGRTYQFTPPVDVVKAGLMRQIPTEFLSCGNDLLRFFLPWVTPSKHQLRSVSSSLQHATGMNTVSISYCPDESAESTTADPTMLSAIDIEPVLETTSCLETILTEVYPVIHRVKEDTRARFASGEAVADVCKELVSQLETLFSVPVDGVPTIYHQLRTEFRQRLAVMRSADSNNSTILRLTKQMFWRKTTDKLTPFGNLMVSIITGTCKAARLLPAQKNLWLLLYARSHNITENRIGAIGFVIATGPPGTGKSRTAEQWLDSMPTSLQLITNTSSAKAYTANDPHADLRCQFIDEMPKYDGDKASEYSLRSNGVLRSERLERRDDGSFDLVKSAKAGRVLCVTCTNDLDTVTAAKMSRASIVSVPAQTAASPDESASTLAAVSNQVPTSIIRDAFTAFCRTMASMQSEFWGLEAAGCFEVDDRMLTVFKCISNNDPSIKEIAARKMVDIGLISRSLMALALCSEWYRQGKGASMGYDQVEMAMWFRDRAVVRMEHVIAAVGIATGSTSVTRELLAVQLTLRRMIKTDLNDMPELSSDGLYYALDVQKRDLSDAVSNANEGFGPGLSKTLLRGIIKGSTNDKPNIKYDSHNNDRQDVVFLNKAYICEVESDVDRLILTALIDKAENTASGTPLMTWDGEYYVFKSSVRLALTGSMTIPNRQCLPLIGQITQAERRLALALFEVRTVRIGTRRAMAWKYEDSIEVAVKVPQGTPSAVERMPGQYFIRRTEIQAMAVHKSILEAPPYMGAADLRYNNLFATCLAVAGGYNDTPSVAGINCGQDGPLFIKPRSGDFELVITNPEYRETDGLDALLGTATGVTELADTIFPHTKKHLHWTPTSNIENICFTDRKQSCSQ
jgi:hypothetical protein